MAITPCSSATATFTKPAADSSHPIIGLGQTLRQARQAYFERAGFDESGYTDRWVKLPVGRFHLYFPNSKSRQRCLPRHDLHHVLTGYATDWRGECQISAWEIGAGCGRYWFAWFINLQGFALGLLRWPRLTWRAFKRGRASRSLYDGRELDPLLDRPVEEIRAALEIPAG